MIPRVRCGFVCRRIRSQDEDDDELTFHDGPIEIEATLTIVKKENNIALVPVDFVKDMKSIGSNSETSNVKVLCNGKVFPCHNTILFSVRGAEPSVCKIPTRKLPKKETREK